MDQLDVQISGDWKPSPIKGRREWLGFAASDAGMVGVALMRDPSALHWARTSHRTGAADLTGNAPQPLEIRLLLADDDDRTWMTFSVGDAQTQTVWTNASRDHDCSFNPPASTPIGRQTVLGKVGANDEIELSCVMLARASVRSQRTGLWRLRDRHLGEVSEFWAALLSQGRKGKLRLEAGGALPNILKDHIA